MTERRAEWRNPPVTLLRAEYIPPVHGRIPHTRARLGNINYFCHFLNNSVTFNENL